MNPTDDDIEVQRSPISGLGIFATRDFEPGEVVLLWNTEKLVRREDLEQVPPEERHYLLDYDADHYFIVQPPQRYINHSCDANTTMGHLCDIAVRKIQEGEEITSDYGQFSLVPFTCCCGAKNCRGKITVAPQNNS